MDGQYSINSLSRLFPPHNSSDPSFQGSFHAELSWGNLLNIYNLTTVKEASAVTDLRQLEVLAGSYFSVAGALVGILKPGRMSMFRTLLVIWGLIKEGILGNPGNTDPTQSVSVSPTILIAVLCAFSSIKYDVKKVQRVAPARPITKPVASSSNSKLQ